MVSKAESLYRTIAYAARIRLNLTYETFLLFIFLMMMSRVKLGWPATEAMFKLFTELKTNLSLEQ